MSTAYVIPVLLAAVILLLVVRAHWWTQQIATYSVTAAWFCLRTRQSKEVAAEMSEVWGFAHVWWRLQHWDLRPFIVVHEHFDAMTEWLARELERTDLDEARWAAEMAAAAAANEGRSLGLPPPPDDVTRN